MLRAVVDLALPALVVVGNQKGSIGIGQGKSKQVPDAIKKATDVAKKIKLKFRLRKDGLCITM